MPFVTRQDLRDAARERADMVNSQFVTDAELNRWIENSRRHLYNKLVGKYEDYFIKWITQASLISLSSPTPGIVVGEADYMLPIDYFKMVLVEEIYSGGGSNELSKYRFADLPRFRGQGNSKPIGYVLYGSNDYDPHGSGAPVTGSRIKLVPPPDQTTYELTLTYVPTCPELTGDAGVAGSMDHINGFNEWVELDVTIKALTKEEAEVGGLVAERNSWMEAMEAIFIPRDIGQPHVAIESMINAGSEPDYYE